MVLTGMHFAEDAQLRAHHKIGHVERADVSGALELDLQRADNLPGSGDLPRTDEHPGGR